MGTTESFPYDDQPSDESGAPSLPKTDGGPPLRRAVPIGPTPSKRPTRPLTRLSGALAGGPKVGKRTLLQRLVGVDPYDSSVDSESVPTVVTIPYSPPPGMPTWNRIQLQVGRVKDGTIPKVDFLVVLLRPDSAEQDVQDHTRQMVRQYMYHLGITSKRPAPEVVSVCICVMVNFQDLVNNRTSESKLDKRLKSLESFLAGVIQPYSIPADRVMLQVMSASVRNGYGLDSLHHFIYRAYLQKKREALEAQLRAVTNQIKATDEPTMIVSRHSDSSPEALPGHDVAAPPVMPRSDTGGKPRLTQPTPEPDTVLQQESSNKPRMAKQTNAIQDTKQAREESTRSKKDNRRQIHTHISPTPRIGKDALEAFFASDSSDGEDHVSKTKNTRERSNVKKKTARVTADISDEDDSDFFYDEGGNFKHTNSAGEEEDSSSSGTSMSHVQATTDQAISRVIESRLPHPVGNKNHPSEDVLEPVGQETSPSSDTIEGLEASLSISSGSESDLENPKPMNDNVREESVGVLSKQTQRRDSKGLGQSSGIVSVTVNTHDDANLQEASGTPRDDDETRSETFSPATDQAERTKGSDKSEPDPIFPPASDTLDRRVAIKPECNTEEGDDGTGKPSIVDMDDGQNFAAKAATTSHFQMDDDDSDEDEFFVDQHQHTLPRANTSTHRNTGGTAWSTVSEIDDDDDDDDEFFVSGEQARPSFEGAMPYTHSKGEEKKLKAVKEAAVPSDMNVRGGVKFDDDSRGDEEYRMDNGRDLGEATSVTQSPAPAIPPMKMESSSPLPSTSGTNNISPAVSQPTATSIPTASNGSGISAAALAAIQAAQRNAEAMLLLQSGANDASSDKGSIMKKAKKNKKEKKIEKDGKSKKKKKKDKSQFNGGDVDVSD